MASEEPKAKPKAAATGPVFGFKSKKGAVAPPSLRDVPLPQEEATQMRPTAVTTQAVATARAMFGAVTTRRAPVVATTAAAAATKKKVVKEPAAAAAATKVPTPEPTVSAPATTAAAAEELVGLLEAQETPATLKLGGLEGDLREMAELILEEESKNLYNTSVPDAYVPTTRRGFADFIYSTYEPFKLPAGPIPMAESEKYYPYQKFVRDYMRSESPYRGILVYHGLGSGKTCTAIAAAEALFASAHKKIIVMSPKSLKKNFLKEISFCGFRHFQLKNFWVPLEKSDPTTMIFANQVLGLSAKYIKSANHIWVPDFRKSPAENNYYPDPANPGKAVLSDDERSEIRKQILSIVDWEDGKNPTARIRFISYNGVTTDKLMKWACDPEERKFFDDAVIVVDEIHNLIRNIQGQIEPYMSDINPTGKKVHRKVPVEQVTPNRWAPGMCEAYRKQQAEKEKKKLMGVQDTKKPISFYKRGYLFYRLLLDARNSKIIGLSGTPLINFPEELGILANVLHGYTTVVEGFIEQSGSAAKREAEEIGHAHPFVDFVQAEQTKDGGGIRVLMTLLPERVKKVSNDVGVRRMDPEEETPSLESIVETLKGVFQEKGMPFKGDLKVTAEALLPPFGADFSSKFLTADKTKLEPTRSNVLRTRITGLVSYYKGSRLELMPRVKSDEVVRVPFSPYAQKAYSLRRNQELAKELEKKSNQTVDDVWKMVYEIGDSAAANNYKMGSRQACNFAFPPEVLRPVAKSKKEELEEAKAGVAAQELVTVGGEEKETGGEQEEDTNVQQDFPELAEGEDEEAAAEEDEAEKDIEAEEDEAAEAAEQEGGGPTPATAPKKTLAQLRAELAAAKVAPSAPAPLDAAQCKAPSEPGKYKEACARARECLKTLAVDRMRLGGTDGLANYSAKYAAMLEKINAAPGSSLVYSQFLDMEGIGIFRVAMEVNGFTPIEIVPSGGSYAFSKRTEDSFKAIRTDEQRMAAKRYMTFSGSEDQTVRGYALDIFNARFAELPDAMSKILTEAGYADNKKGEICRVFCITSAGAEGLSLRNVRAVHIMEPYWNEVRLRQVKGRAIRIGSHLDLPEDQRDVSIYTYISCFSDVAQGKEAGDNRIDETILIHDSVDRQKAIANGLPIKPTATSYTLTTDEMIYTIMERKRKIVEELEGILKSASVDCELNLKQNNDGTFQCLPLKGKVGDFVYHPLLDRDISEASQFKQGAIAPVAAAAAVVPLTEKERKQKQRDDYLAKIRGLEESGGDAAEIQKYKGFVAALDLELRRLEAPSAAEGAKKVPKELIQKFGPKKLIYKLVETFGADGEPDGFDMINPATNKKVGHAAWKDGKPAKPVVAEPGWEF